MVRQQLTGEVPVPTLPSPTFLLSFPPRLSPFGLVDPVVRVRPVTESEALTVPSPTVDDLGPTLGQPWSLHPCRECLPTPDPVDVWVRIEGWCPPLSTEKGTPLETHEGCGSSTKSVEKWTDFVGEVEEVDSLPV